MLLVLTFGVLSYFWLFFCNILLHRSYHAHLFCWQKIGDVGFKIFVCRTVTLVIRVFGRRSVVMFIVDVEFLPKCYTRNGHVALKIVFIGNSGAKPGVLTPRSADFKMPF